MAKSELKAPAVSKQARNHPGMARSSCPQKCYSIACLGGLLPCRSRGWLNQLNKRHLNSCLMSIALLPYYWFLLTLSYHLSMHFQMNWKVNCKTGLCVYVFIYTCICVHVYTHTHTNKFLGLCIFHIWPYLTAAVVQKSLPPNKQTERPMRRKLWFSAVARVQAGRREQLCSVRPRAVLWRDGGWTPATGRSPLGPSFGTPAYRFLGVSAFISSRVLSVSERALLIGACLYSWQEDTNAFQNLIYL